MSAGNQQSAVFPDQVRDYDLLTRRWLRLARRLPWLQFRIYAEESGYPLMLLESRIQNPGAPSFYVSAGIHGDEPASVEGLIRWAGDDLAKLAGWNLQIFPCLNPWGLERNIRFDSEGRDLNRCYNKRSVPQISAQLSAMRGWKFDLALMLHEDYDARGFYLYEIAGVRPYWGEEICNGLSEFGSPDPRHAIDGHRAKQGVIRRRVHPQLLKGHPEAFRLHFHHAKRTFTFESPSEDFLVQRVKLHQEFIKIALKRLPPLRPIPHRQHV